MSSSDGRSCRRTQQRSASRMTNTSCLVSCRAQDGLDARTLDAVHLGQALAAIFCCERSCAQPQLVRGVVDDPRAELLPNFGFADALDHLDACFAQDGNASTIDLRMRVSHANHD